VELVCVALAWPGLGYVTLHEDSLHYATLVLGWIKFCLVGLQLVV